MLDTHGLSVKAATAQIARMKDRDRLLRTREREEAHPDGKGVGRKKVIEAIDDQLKRLDPAPAEGAWRENAWAGLPHYECTRCPFDTLELAAIREHVKSHDPKPAEAEPEQPAEPAQPESAPATVADATAPETEV